MYIDLRSMASVGKFMSIDNLELLLFLGSERCGTKSSLVS
jgi:hypothetical protein